jgi:hypothetical protein
VHLRVGRLPPAGHLAVCGPEVDRSAQASWSARPQVEAWSVDRCVAARQPEARRRVACARNARAATCRQAACRQAASLSEQQSAEPSVSDVPAQPLVAVGVVVCESARRPVEAWVPSALQAGAAAEVVAEP